MGTDAAKHQPCTQQHDSALQGEVYLEQWCPPSLHPGPCPWASQQTSAATIHVLIIAAVEAVSQSVRGLVLELPNHANQVCSAQHMSYVDKNLTERPDFNSGHAAAESNSSCITQTQLFDIYMVLQPNECMSSNMVCDTFCNSWSLYCCKHLQFTDVDPAEIPCW